jgi:hypothetical protein
MESCFIIVVSGETGAGAGGGVVFVVSKPVAGGGAAFVVSTPAAVGGGGRIVVSAGAARPVSGGAWPTLLSLL